MSEKAVKAFLNNVMGYKKIEDLFRGRRPQGMELKRFFQGTVFGTFAYESTLGVARWPNIPRIYRLQDVRTSIAPNGGLDVKLDEGNFCFLDEDAARMGLPFLLYSTSFFRYESPEEVEQRAAGLRKLFLKLRYNKKTRDGSFTLNAMCDGFYFQVSGQNYKKSDRIITVSFNTDADVVDDLNGLVRRYRRDILHYPETSIVNGKEIISPSDGASPANPNYRDLLAKMEQMQPHDFAIALGICKSRPYEMNAKLREGAVLDHKTFGKGIVVKTDGDVKEVYFPGINTTKRLV